MTSPGSGNRWTQMIMLSAALQSSLLLTAGNLLMQNAAGLAAGALLGRLLEPVLGKALRTRCRTMITASMLLYLPQLIRLALPDSLAPAALLSEGLIAALLIGPGPWKSGKRQLKDAALRLSRRWSRPVMPGT